MAEQGRRVRPAPDLLISQFSGQLTASHDCGLTSVLLLHLLDFKLGWSEIAQGGMHTLVQVHLIEKSPDLSMASAHGVP